MFRFCSDPTLCTFFRMLDIQRTYSSHGILVDTQPSGSDINDSAR